MIEILQCYKPSKRLQEETTSNDDNAAPTTSNDHNTYNDEIIDGKENVSKLGSVLESEVAPTLTICDSYIRYKNDKANRWKNKKKYQNKQPHARVKTQVNDSEIVCCIIFVKSRLISTIIHYLLSVSSNN